MDETLELPGPGRAETLVEGLDHPEGVAWDPRAGIVWAGGEAGQLYRVDMTSRRAEEVARAPGFVLGLAVDGRGRLAVCCSGDRSLCVYEAVASSDTDVAHTRDAVLATVTTGAVAPLGAFGATAVADAAGSAPRVRALRREVDGEVFALPNVPVFAPDGTLYLSDSGEWAAGGGRIVRVEADGAAAVFSRELRDFPNGLAVTPDGRWLWCASSYEPTVHRFDLQSADGRAELVTRVDGAVLDGLAFTADGGCLVTCYRPDRIYHLGADGSLDVVADDPKGTLISAPTNACFVGARLDRVVSANLGRWHLTLLDLGLTGAPLHYPATWAADA